MLGGAGGAVRALNDGEPVKVICIRIATGGFFALLGGLLIKGVGLPMEIQYAIAGIIGCTTSETMRMLQKKFPNFLGKRIDSTLNPTK